MYVCIAISRIIPKPIMLSILPVSISHNFPCYSCVIPMPSRTVYYSYIILTNNCVACYSQFCVSIIGSGLTRIQNNIWTCLGIISLYTYVLAENMDLHSTVFSLYNCILCRFIVDMGLLCWNNFGNNRLWKNWE